MTDFCEYYIVHLYGPSTLMSLKTNYLNLIAATFWFDAVWNWRTVVKQFTLMARLDVVEVIAEWLQDAQTGASQPTSGALCRRRSICGTQRDATVCSRNRGKEPRRYQPFGSYQKPNYVKTTAKSCQYQKRSLHFRFNRWAKFTYEWIFSKQFFDLNWLLIISCPFLQTR